MKAVARFWSGAGAALALGSMAWAQATGSRASSDSAPILMPPQAVEAAPTWRTVEELIAAADAGNALAAFQYAQLLEYGDQVAADPAKAVAFYRAAAEAGNANAAFRLGRAYADRELGLPRDFGRTLAYYQAAVGTVPEAIFNLGAMYASGRGVRRDFVEGLAWLLVAKQDHDLGGDAAAQVQRRLSAARVAEAEKRAAAIRRELAGEESAEKPTAPAAASRASAPRPADLAPVRPPVTRPKAEVEVAPVVPSAPVVPTAPPRPTFSLPPPQITLPAPPPAPDSE
jgi:TPR repeat protein